MKVWTKSTESFQTLPKVSFYHASLAYKPLLVRRERIQRKLQFCLNWETKEQFRRTISSASSHFIFKIIHVIFYGSASVA